MGIDNADILETWEINGIIYVVMFEQMCGLWWVVERDNGNAVPFLRDRKWIESGEKIDP